MTLFMVLYAFGSNPSSLSSLLLGIKKREYKKYNKIQKKIKKKTTFLQILLKSVFSKYEFQNVCMGIRFWIF